MPFIKYLTSLSPIFYFCLSSNYRLCLSPNVLPVIHQFAVFSLSSNYRLCLSPNFMPAFHKLPFSAIHQIALFAFLLVFHELSGIRTLSPVLLRDSSTKYPTSLSSNCRLFHLSHVIPVITSHQNSRFLPLPILASIPFTKCITRLSSNCPFCRASNHNRCLSFCQSLTKLLSLFHQMSYQPFATRKWRTTAYTKLHWLPFTICGTSLSTNYVLFLSHATNGSLVRPLSKRALISQIVAIFFGTADTDSIIAVVLEQLFLNIKTRIRSTKV